MSCTAFRTYAKAISDCLHPSGGHLRHLKIRRSKRHPGIQGNARSRHPADLLRHPFGQRRPGLPVQRKPRKMLDAAGFADAVISASNDLDENLITCSEDPGRSHQLLGCRHKPDHLQGLPVLRRCLQAGCHHG